MIVYVMKGILVAWKQFCQLRLANRFVNIRVISYYHSIIIWLILSLRKTTDMFEL